MKTLSERLLVIAKQVNEGDVICDIGTDHALIPIYLAKANIIKYAYACDVAEKPLENAKENIEKYEVGNIIKPIQADGLSWITTEQIDTCIISGMGSFNIFNILDNDSTSIKRYILCPNDDGVILREWAKTNKYYIERELMIKENDIIYEVIVINKFEGKKIRNIKDIYFGPFLRREASPLFKEKWLLKDVYYNVLLSKIPPDSNKYKEIQKRIKLINKVL